MTGATVAPNAETTSSAATFTATSCTPAPSAMVRPTKRASTTSGQEVVDPKGVVPVGEMAVYEIHIKNRGMTAARGVNVVAMFSEGIDPSHVEGGQHSIRDGRVTFRPDIYSRDGLRDLIAGHDRDPSEGPTPAQTLAP